MSRHSQKPPPFPSYRKLDRVIIVILSVLLCFTLGWAMYSKIELHTHSEAMDLLRENRLLYRQTLDATSDSCEQMFRLGEAYRITLTTLMEHFGLTADAPVVAVLDAYRKMTLLRGINAAIGGSDDGKTDLSPIRRRGKRYR